MVPKGVSFYATAGLLTTDPRVRERKKPGQEGRPEDVHLEEALSVPCGKARGAREAMAGWAAAS